MKFLVIFLIFFFFDNALSVVTPDVKKATVTATPAKPICKPTEVYVPCRDPCPETCKSILIGPKLGCLPALPCPAGCDCRPGYVRDDEGECVPIDECPPPCGPNEEWDLCPPCPEGAICPAVCLPACRCKDGYQYNDEGICEEALICGQNEVLNVCPRYCTFDPDCDSYMFGFIRDCAAPPDFFPCTPRCDCIKGYLRIDGTCQKPSKCCSDPFERVVDCPAPCVETCSYKPPAGCKENCRIRTCRCVTGFVKYNGKCRPRASCPITKPTISPIAEDE